MWRDWLLEVALMLGAAGGFIASYGVPVRYNQGPEGRWWETVRRGFSRLFERFLQGTGPRPITTGEYAGSLSCDLDRAEALLYSEGFVRNPTSRLKTRGDEPEAGSWVYRDSPLAPRQLHLMLFQTEDGTTDVYAHEELSSVHPLCGPDHLRGTGQSVSAGVHRARRWFPLDDSDATVTPPEGSWDESSQLE